MLLPAPEILTIPARDGYRLTATLYRSHPDADKAVLSNFATGMRRSYYHKFASFLAESGFAALTFDYRGIGNSRSQSLHGFWEEIFLTSLRSRCLPKVVIEAYTKASHKIPAEKLPQSWLDREVKIRLS